MDSVVGTNIGEVHNQRQGTGLATVLQGDSAVDTYARLWQVDQAKQARAQQERAAKRNAAMGALKSFSPEWFYKHDAEMNAAVNDHFQKGAALLERIDDPFTSNDPSAVEWQKEHARIQAMSKSSMQIKDQWAKYQGEILGAKPDDYDARSLANAMSFFDMPLSEIVATGATPPVLMKKKPFLQMSEFIGKNMGQWQSTRGEQPPTDNEIYDFVNGLANEPANKDQFVSGYGSKLAQLDEQERRRITETAANAGREPWQQMAFEDAKRWQKKGKPFDLQGELKVAAQMAEGGVDYTEWSTPEGFGKAPKKGSKEAAIKSAIDATFNSDDRWMTVYDREGALPRGAEETDGEYAKRVKAYMATQIDPLVGISTKSGKTDKAGKDAELRASQEQFIADIRSGDTVRMQGAANALVGEKFAANLTVENAAIQNQGGGNIWLELDVVTPMSTKDVKQEVIDANTGLGSEDVTVEERQGKKIIKIGLAPGAISNQTLLGVLGNKKYDTRFTERGAKTAIEAAKAPVNTNKTATTGPTVGSDFFK